MELVIIIGVVVGILIAIGAAMSAANSKGPGMETKSQVAARMSEYDRRQDATINVIRKCVTEHRKRLALKNVQLIRQDEYGTFQFDAFIAECGKFYDSVVRRKLREISCDEHEDYLTRDDIIEYISLLVDEICEDEIKDLHCNQADFRDDMTGVEYEQLVSTLLAGHGWTVSGTTATGDQGVDLLAEKDGRRVAVQCKRFARPVGNKAVQEAAAGRTHYACNEAWVVSNAGFTPSARQLASSVDVALLGHDELADA